MDDAFSQASLDVLRDHIDFKIFCSCHQRDALAIHVIDIWVEQLSDEHLGQHLGILVLNYFNTELIGTCLLLYIFAVMEGVLECIGLFPSRLLASFNFVV